jgi:hypothetical protein
VFDFVEGYLAPGALAEDTHHLGVQVWNSGTEEATIRLRLGRAEIHVRLAPDRGIGITDEDSQAVLVENQSAHAVTLIWKKSRD